MIEAPSARCCRLLVENLRDVLYLIDLERRALVFISPSVEQLLGYSVEEIHAMDLGTLVARLGPAAQEDASRELGLGSARRLELELTRKDRVPIWVEVDRTTLADGDGRRSVLGVVREITRRRQTEERLRESEENLRSFFESLDDMAFVVGPDGKIASCNRTALRKLGYNQEALVGRPLVELHPPALRDEATATVASMLRGERDSCPLPVMSRGGDTIPVETRVWSGRWGGREVLFGLCKDLSKEQEALQKYHRLFDANPALMAVTSAETRCFVEVNQAWLGRLGYLRDEVIGRSPEELELFPGRADQRAVRDQLLSTGRISKIELEVRRKDGELLTGLFTGETIRSQGRTYLLTVMVDITEQKRAEARLLAAKAELERLNAELRVQAEEARQRLDQVKTLRGIIPICCVCKRIRDDEQYWSQVEAYIEQHTDAQFSHSYCPECAAKQFPEE